MSAKISTAEYFRKRQSDRRAWALKMLGGVCAICGTAENLQFDHIDPETKLFTIANGLRGRAMKDLLVELGKCQLLCQPHHQDKTGRSQHGGRRKYLGGCRCAPCRENQNRKSREYKRLWRQGLVGSRHRQEGLS